MAVTQNSKTNKVADVIVGYSYLWLTDVDVFELADGEDDATDKVTIPAKATGAILRVEHTSSAPEIRFSVNGSTPSIADGRGVPVYEDETEIHIGYTAQNPGSRSELDNFLSVIDTGKTATIHVTYVQRLV